MISAIIVSVFLLSTVYTIFFSKEKAFLNIYLPILFLTPDGLHLEIPGIPHFGLNQIALIPIFGSFILNGGVKKIAKGGDYGLWTLLVSVYIFLSIYSEYVNTASVEGSLETLWQHRLVFMLLNVWVPFVIGKNMIFQKKLFIPFAKRIVILMLINLFLFIFEWRLTTSLLFRFFSLIAPDQVHPNVSTRFGVYLRLAGPFPHPILTGFVFAMAFLLNTWLSRNKLWKNDSWFVLFYFSKGTYIAAGLLLGLILTFSRGPLYPMILAYMLIGIGYLRLKWIHLFVRLSALAVIITIYFLANQVYFESEFMMSGKESEAELTNTALYRIQLLDVYAPYIAEKPLWGWGIINQLGKRTGMPSIDNHYLNILIGHGFLVLGSFVLICLTVLFYLFKKAMSQNQGDVMLSSLCFTLFGIYLTMILTFATVWMGGQTEPLFFLFTGLSVELMQVKKIDIPQNFSGLTWDKGLR